MAVFACCKNSVQYGPLDGFFGIHTHPFYGPLDFVWDYLGEPVPEAVWILLKQETVSGSGIQTVQIQFQPGLCPRSHWVSLQRSPNPIVGHRHSLPTNHSHSEL